MRNGVILDFYADALNPRLSPYGQREGAYGRRGINGIWNAGGLSPSPRKTEITREAHRAFRAQIQKGAEKSPIKSSCAERKVRSTGAGFPTVNKNGCFSPREAYGKGSVSFIFTADHILPNTGGSYPGGMK